MMVDAQRSQYGPPCKTNVNATYLATLGLKFQKSGTEEVHFFEYYTLLFCRFASPSLLLCCQPNSNSVSVSAISYQLLLSVSVTVSICLASISKYIFDYITLLLQIS